VTEPGRQTSLFDDGKDSKALRTIGEVASALGIKQHVLRYWEQQFPMLRPLKRSGGRRYYRPGDVELVTTIDRLVNREGYTLKGARQALSKGGPAHAARPLVRVNELDDVAERELMLQLHAIRRRLAEALEL
jgi:DNA-binding transcriptional MerR regulator